MIEKNFPSLGLKQMHPMQIEALMELINVALCAAAHLGEEELEEAEAASDELIRLLGGNGVSVRMDVY